MIEGEPMVLSSVSVGSFDWCRPILLMAPVPVVRRTEAPRLCWIAACTGKDHVNPEEYPVEARQNPWRMLHG